MPGGFKRTYPTVRAAAGVEEGAETVVAVAVSGAAAKRLVVVPTGVAGIWVWPDVGAASLGANVGEDSQVARRRLVGAEVVLSGLYVGWIILGLNRQCGSGYCKGANYEEFEGHHVEG